MPFRSGRRAACKACTAAATRKARAKQPPKLDLLKHRVRERTHEAIRRGELVPLPCRVCGAAQAEAHHPTYEGERAHLDVDWLCDEHHALEHGKSGWTRQRDLFPPASPSN